MQSSVVSRQQEEKLRKINPPLVEEESSFSNT
jgi:hypothetical protein